MIPSILYLIILYTIVSLIYCIIIKYMIKVKIKYFIKITIIKIPLFKIHIIFLYYNKL